MEHLAVDLDLDGRLGQQLGAGALLDEAGVVDDPERRDVARLVAPDQELERASAPSNARPSVSSRLMSSESTRRVDDAVELVAELLGPDLGVRPAAELGHDQPALVADGRRVDVLVAPLDLGDGRAMDAALVGERRPADVRLVVVRG